MTREQRLRWSEYSTGPCVGASAFHPTPTTVFDNKGVQAQVDGEISQQRKKIVDKAVSAIRTRKRALKSLEDKEPDGKTAFKVAQSSAGAVIPQ
jgi:hypothetical protein